MATEAFLNVDDKRSDPTSQAFADAAAHLRPLDHFDILEYCVGFDKPDFPKLMEDCVLLSLSVENQKPYPIRWAELGISTLQRKEAQKHIARPGEHSEALMKCASFCHIRIEENMRFLNMKEDAKDRHSHRNRFGQTCFTSEKDAKDILSEVLIDKPIVLLVFNENENPYSLSWSLELPPEMFNSVVATISTQRIAREQNIDWNMEKRKNLEDIGKSLGFQCENLDGPSNQAGFNLVAAIQIAMRARIKLSKIPLQTKVKELQIESQSQYNPWGVEKLCFKCGSTNHSAYSVHGQDTCDMPWQDECDPCWEVEKPSNHSKKMCPKNPPSCS
ncbi:hypothetical protein J1614_003827 [Plenodomus biglobosus]|nr:hypothetical protein J1614_003827 [Plenodomus biglobosus]